MNHRPAPEVTRADYLGLLQRLRRWWHFKVWEYGTSHNRDARRNRITRDVQYVMNPMIAKAGGWTGVRDGEEYWVNFSVTYKAGFVPDIRRK